VARIAVVDDEALVRDMLSEFLGRLGHEVVSAGDGHEALEILRKHPADLVITDIVTPVMYGLEVIREVRSEFPETRIIAMTGFNPARLMLARELGADRLIQKPFPTQEIRECLDELLEGETSGAGGRKADPVA
jgi:two-component system chemotaxis response regulator CheY